MRKARIAVASSALVVLLAGPCLAQDTFRAEAGLSFARTKFDAVRADIAGIDGTYFFDELPSRPKDYPLDQVPFVERAASVSANAARSSFDYDGPVSADPGASYGAAVQFARPDTFLTARAGYQYLDTGKTSSQGVESDNKTKAYLLSLGAYVAKTTAVSLDWIRNDLELTSNVGTLDKRTDTFIDISVQHLARLSGGDHVAVAARIGQIRFEQPGLSTEKNHEFEIRATYYPTKMLGLTFGLETDRGDRPSFEGETYTVGAKTFFTPAFSLSLDYRKFNAKDASGNDFDTITLRGALRF